MFSQEELKQLRFMSQAIWNLRPNTTWELPRPDYNSLVWKDEEKDAPSYEDVVSEMAILEQQYEAEEWKRNRVAAYPPISDQLDVIFHDGLDVWRQNIQEIKNTFPKPE